MFRLRAELNTAKAEQERLRFVEFEVGTLTEERDILRQQLEIATDELREHSFNACCESALERVEELEKEKSL